MAFSACRTTCTRVTRHDFDPPGVANTPHRALTQTPAKMTTHTTGKPWTSSGHQNMVEAQFWVAKGRHSCTRMYILAMSHHVSRWATMLACHYNNSAIMRSQAFLTRPGRRMRGANTCPTLRLPCEGVLICLFQLAC